MDDIQFLRRGARIRIVGNLPAVVEHNPEDGAWLLARYVRAPTEPGEQAREAVMQAGLQSPHTWTSMTDERTGDVLVYLHAGDILGMWES